MLVETWYHLKHIYQARVEYDLFGYANFTCGACRSYGMLYHSRNGAPSSVQNWLSLSFGLHQQNWSWCYFNVWDPCIKKTFKSICRCILEISPWLFMQDHSNYAQLGSCSSQWHDRVAYNTPHSVPRVREQAFLCKDTKHTFSTMSIDQCHEQVSKLIKCDGGAVGLTETPQALDRWMVAWLEISWVLYRFEVTYQISQH